MIRDNLHLMGSTTSSSTSFSSQSSYPASSSWSRSQDKLFEQSLVLFPEETPNRWEKIATQVPGKTALEVEQHYQVLVDDVNAIEAGLVELPCYTDDLLDSKHKTSETERRKGTPWTEEEHKLFLIGLQKYGKGDWRSISRNAVISRTPTQVASHAQKYFNRINSDKKEKKRSSIHDITVDDASVLQASVLQAIVPGSDSSQQTMVPLSGQPQQGIDAFNSQVPFNNAGGGSGYQSYGYLM